jgi:uncharacterized membrane protein YccC
MTVAAAATFVLGTILDMPQSFWAVIAALIVSQGSIGGSLKAALEQLIGSVCGAIYGGVITLSIPHQTPAMLCLALVIAVAPLALLATVSPGFRVAPITAVLVMLSTIGVEMGPVGFAVERVLEIGLGCTIGLAASLLVAPVHAYDSVLRTAGQVALLLADQVEMLAIVWNQQDRDVSELPTRIRLTLSRLETLAQEAARERRSRLTHDPDPEPLSRTLARLHVDVSTLGRIVTSPLPEDLHRRLSEPWQHVVGTAAGVLRHAGRALPARRLPKSLDAVDQAIAAYEAAVADVRRAGLTKDLSNEAVARVFALGFVLDQFRRNLEDLVSRIAEVQHPG